MLNIAVLVSGGGTNLQALIDAEKAGKIENGKISVVVASKPGVYALERALSALDDKFIHCNFPFCGRGISSAVKGTLPAATQRRNALHEVGSFVMPAGP